uniref:EF-hand domain-containing protein n=1 Tax=Palpitomonas bilix TaxID=652834 RepID=A0A7S3D8C7_9EUKA|mmetsp:Transcript_26723/g.68677  ORF Transcript_26723/g.68677 Transcript_26723/m.68677 type:complete len:194 (+) Transcript_26723:192-773(+)|eukprot:CAMPEP_0113879512 /NCGR_PEP_ID=MMETSP0780_2-20120614/7278_1 /TAXON_ID=652834 /ORGANISM="Palpitomonas bilix" /LENGTH=193 /DNA_ID=CAMNT_0000866099 /DNA_START=179 /DNA_END=760 /DNA_ORIENTATION=- /assembly_acc=CAM_ASM_000599
MAGEDTPKRKTQPIERRGESLGAVRRNEYGGVYVDEEELRAAFNFFDTQGKGHIVPADLRSRLGIFYKTLPAREYRFLISEPEFNLKTLTRLLENNEITNFDPVREAFKVYDPHDTGYIDVDTLRHIFSNLGFGELSPDDVDILIKTADVDGDGKISLEDFRGMFEYNRQLEESGEAEKLISEALEKRLQGKN